MLLRTWKIVLFWCLCVVIGAATGVKWSELRQSMQQGEIYAGRMQQAVVRDGDQKELYQWFVNGQRVQWLVTHLSDSNEFVFANTKNMARKEIHARQAWAAKQPVVVWSRWPKRVARFAQEHILSYRHLAVQIDMPVADVRRSRVTLKKSLFSVFLRLS